jgi:hypothetical protein
MTKKEYKVVIYAESALSSVVLGESKVDPLRFAEFLNKHADEGWRVVTMEREIRRTALFFDREALVVLLERDRA